MKTYLEPKEVDRIEQAAECLRDKLLVRLLAHLGCRVSEALGITVSDIDFEKNIMMTEVLKRRQRIKKEAILTPEVTTLLKQYILRNKLKPDDYVFSTHRNTYHALLHGVDPVSLLDEILGKPEGRCMGRAHSMGFIDHSRHFYSSAKIGRAHV